jgi:chromate reductase
MLLLVSGSPHPQSANSRLLRGLGRLSHRAYAETPYLTELPLFQPALDKSPWPASVVRWRRAVKEADALIFSTPAYLENLPGVLKNSLDWLATSGDIQYKPALVFTFTPHAPRGETARQSLLWSLQALEVRVVAETALFQDEVSILENGDIAAGDYRDMLTEALRLLPV